MWIILIISESRILKVGFLIFRSNMEHYTPFKVRLSLALLVWSEKCSVINETNVHEQ